jgi:hypothetical protein
MYGIVFIEEFQPVGGIRYDIAYLTLGMLRQDHVFPLLITRAN